MFEFALERIGYWFYNRVLVPLTRHETAFLVMVRVDEPEGDKVFDVFDGAIGNGSWGVCDGQHFHCLKDAVAYAGKNMRGDALDDFELYLRCSDLKFPTPDGFVDVLVHGIESARHDIGWSESKLRHDLDAAGYKHAIASDVVFSFRECDDWWG